MDVPSTNRVQSLCDPTVPDTAPTVNRVRRRLRHWECSVALEIRVPTDFEKAFCGD
jgi:hypothetical protein